MFADGKLDIFLTMLEIRYMLTLFAFDIDMCHLSPRRAYRVAEQHIELKAISSDTKWHISMLKLLFVKTNNSFNMGQGSKKSQNRSKTEVAKPKGIFYFCLPLIVFLSH